MNRIAVDLNARGVCLRALEAGRGGEPLLIFHGFGGAKEDFGEWVDPLGELGWHVVVADHRGHGESDKPDGADSYSFATFVDDALALADALGWERFTLLGHSMGGYLAQRLALKAPHRLRGLVLMDTAHSAPDGIGPETVEVARKVVEDGGMALLVELQRGRDDPLATPAHKRLVAERPGYAEFGEAKTLACSPDMWRKVVLEVVSSDDILPSLAAIDVPTLVIVGEQDKPFIAHCERMAKTIPRARLAVIADAGHSPQFENPAAWWDVLSGFLGELTE